MPSLFDESRLEMQLPQASKEVLKALLPYKRAKAPKSLHDRAMEKAQELSDRATDSSRDAFQATKEQAGPAYERAKGWGSEAYGAAREKAKQLIEGGKEPTQPSSPPVEPKKPDAQ